MNRDLIVMYIPVIVLCAVFAAITVVKIIVLIRYRGADIAVILKSFFRIYSSMELKMTSSDKKRSYMKYNNLLNSLLYTFFALLLVLAAMYLKYV